MAARASDVLAFKFSRDVEEYPAVVDNALNVEFVPLRYLEVYRRMAGVMVIAPEPNDMSAASSLMIVAVIGPFIHSRSIFCRACTACTLVVGVHHTYLSPNFVSGRTVPMSKGPI